MDLYKISDAIELMPPLDAMSVQRLMRVAYDHWFSEDGFIDPHPRRADHVDKLGLRYPDNLLTYFHSRDRNVPLFGLTELLSTPRALKRLLADVERTWARLKGEAELDDIIVVNALLHAAAPVIDFLMRNIDAARLEPDRSSRLSSENSIRIEDEWKGLLDALDNPRAVQSLVDLLGISRLTKDGVIVGERSPQDVANYEPTDYFRRILAGNIAAGEVRDQSVLADMKDWRDRGGDQLVTELVAVSEANDRYSRVWEHFAKTQFSNKALLELASGVHARLLRRKVGSFIFKESPGAIGIWRLLGKRQTKKWADWLSNEIRMALPISLLFGADLYYWYGSVTHGVVDSEGRARVRADSVAEARAIYREASDLIAVLSLDQPFALTHFIRPPTHDEPPETVGLAQLRWFAELVADATHLAPRLTIPDVVATFGSSGRRVERVEGGHLVQTYELDRAEFLEFFGERADEVLEQIVSFPSDIPFVSSAKPEFAKWQQERGGENA